MTHTVSTEQTVNSVIHSTQVQRNTVYHLINFKKWCTVVELLSTHLIFALRSWCVLCLHASPDSTEKIKLWMIIGGEKDVGESDAQISNSVEENRKLLCTAHGAWYIQFLSCAEVVWRTPISVNTAGAWGKQWTRRNESSCFNSAKQCEKCREESIHGLMGVWEEVGEAVGVCVFVCLCCPAQWLIQTVSKGTRPQKHKLEDKGDQIK